MTRRALVVACAAGLAAAGAVVAGALHGRSPRPGPTVLLVSGNIEAHESLLGFERVQGRLLPLPVEEGQWVEAGAVVARLDDGDLRRQAAIDASALRMREAQLASAQQAREAARRMVEADLVELEQRRLDAGRLRALWREGIVSRHELDRVETALALAETAVARDRALEDARRRDVEVARAAVRHAAEQLRLSRRLVGHTVLRAPFAGVVLVRQSEPGEVLQPGTPVVTLADLGRVWLRAYVQEPYLGRIRHGQGVTVRTDDGRTFPGRIAFIAARAEFTPKSVETHAERVTLVYRVRIDVENPEHALKPGMPADAEIPLAALQDDP